MATPHDESSLQNSVQLGYDNEYLRRLSDILTGEEIPQEGA